MVSSMVIPTILCLGAEYGLNRLEGLRNIKDLLPERRESLLGSQALTCEEVSRWPLV
jgi:hypothetical protein